MKRFWIAAAFLILLLLPCWALAQVYALLTAVKIPAQRSALKISLPKCSMITQLVSAK